MEILQRSIVDLKGVGPQIAERLARLQIRTLQDILFHLPNKYVDRTRIYPLSTVRVNDIVVIEANIEKVTIIPKPKRSLVVKLRDGSTTAEVRLFYFTLQQQQQFKIGMHMRCFGQARLGRSGLQFIHPEYKILSPGQIVPVEEYLTPIYPAVDGISQKLLRTLVQQALTMLMPIKNSLEILPAFVREKFDFLPLFECLQAIHFPTPDIFAQILNAGRHPAQQRLAFEELLAHHLSLRQKRLAKQKDNAYSIKVAHDLAKQLLADLPFSLTNAQLATIATIYQDLANNYPMLRLVQGDVGSGKTLVAFMAALATIEAGFTVVFMAPTEILAEQHYNNMQKWCNKLNIMLACLTGKMSAKQKKDIKQQILDNKLQLVLGTHALFQDDVQFNNLGLIIIDEQHKFGVAQRLALQKKGQHIVPHQLVLTATPIPRTLAMTFYADLDYSVIDELPPGRQPISTLMISDKRRNEIVQRVANICASGQQVYWVCTLINESEVIDCTPAERTHEELQTQLPALNIGLIHAKIPTAEKELIMRQFALGQIDLLVATTVIEVGVDVPNATLMVIENPERLGLAQLHQLRGRVGRGNLQSYCVLLYKAPLGAKAMQRLQFMRESQDGFAIAELDLQLRGPGEIFGTRQSGLANLRIADLVRDKDLLLDVAKVAEQIQAHNFATITPLLQRWIRDQIEYAVV